MKMGKFLTSVAIVGLAAGLVAATVSSAEARVRWKVHSAYGKKLFVIGTGPHRLSEAISRMTDGDFELKVFEPGALVPGTKYYDPVSEGSIDAAWGTPGYNVHKNLAYAFFAAVPFGPSAGEYMAWMRHGGGQELADELYEADNIKFFMCNMIAPESSGWFREPIESVEDLKGLKMRFFGLGARVMERFGVSTQLLSAGDIYPALELGTIDATEFSMPAIDRDLGFYQIAKHNYYPGWHQQSTIGELLVNMDKYNELNDVQKAILEQACQAQVMRSYAETEAFQGEAMDFFRSKGVTIHRWPKEILDQFDAAWQEVVKEEIGSNQKAQKIWESLSKFRETYALWKANGYVN